MCGRRTAGLGAYGRRHRIGPIRCRYLDHDTAVGRKTGLIEVQALALGAKASLQQPVQVGLQQLDQLLLFAQHPVQRREVSRQCGGDHETILPNKHHDERNRQNYFAHSRVLCVQRERRQSPNAREVHAIEQQGEFVLGEFD